MHTKIRKFKETTSINYFLTNNFLFIEDRVPTSEVANKKYHASQF